MTSSRSIVTICETNPVMRLLKQQNRHYALAVIERVFRDEYAVEAPVDHFYRVCAVVREELQAREGEEKHVLMPHKQLEIWCDTNREAEPWLAIKDDPRAGKMVALRPAARQVLEFALSTEEEADTMSSQALKRFFSSLAHAASHLQQDKATLLERLRAEIAEREREIAKIERDGTTPPSAQDKERYAAELVQFVSGVLQTLGLVPARLRDNIRAARDSFDEIEGSHGRVLREVLELLESERSRPGYMMLRDLNEVHHDERRREYLERAVETIIEHCGDYMTERARREARTLFSTLTEISLRILTEDHQAAIQIGSFVEQDTFMQRRGQSRLLEELSDFMRQAAPLMRVRMRGGSGATDPGFRIGHERVSRLHWFDLRLSDGPPPPATVQEPPPPATPLDKEEARRRITAATAKSAYLDEAQLETWIKGVVAKNGPTPMSRILVHRPMRYGLEEIGRYIQIAMTRLPSEFRRGWEIEIGVTDSADPFAGPLVGPGRALLVRCADPIFMAEGAPGQGLSADGGLLARAETVEDALESVGVKVAEVAEVPALRLLRPKLVLQPVMA